MLDLGFIVDAEAVPVEVIGKVGGSYDPGGKWVGETKVSTPAMATVQPTSGKILRDLPEGIRAEARFTLWSRFNVQLNDVVRYAGQDFLVTFVWPRLEGGFTRAILGMQKP